MTAIDATTIFEVVDPPVGVPHRYGLLSVLDPTDEQHLGLGIKWESPNGALALTTTDICFDPGTTPLTPDAYCQLGSVKAVTPYIYDVDSIAGRNAAEHRNRARQRFALAEQYGIELAVSSALDTAVTPVAQTLGTEPDAKVKALIATIEQEIGAFTGAVGTIHMSRFAATLAGSCLIREGGQLRTKLGTPVAAYTGWTHFTAGTPVSTVTIYGTGPMRAARGPIELFDGAPDLQTNDVAIIAGRTYAIGWDVNAVGASVTL